MALPSLDNPADKGQVQEIVAVQPQKIKRKVSSSTAPETDLHPIKKVFASALIQNQDESAVEVEVPATGTRSFLNITSNGADLRTRTAASTRTPSSSSMLHS